MENKNDETGEYQDWKKDRARVIPALDDVAGE
jgi:hypothetical protein